MEIWAIQYIRSLESFSELKLLARKRFFTGRLSENSVSSWESVWSDKVLVCSSSVRMGIPSPRTWTTEWLWPACTMGDRGGIPKARWLAKRAKLVSPGPYQKNPRVILNCSTRSSTGSALLRTACSTRTHSNLKCFYVLRYWLLFYSCIVEWCYNYIICDSKCNFNYLVHE